MLLNLRIILDDPVDHRQNAVHPRDELRSTSTVHNSHRRLPLTDLGMAPTARTSSSCMTGMTPCWATSIAGCSGYCSNISSTRAHVSRTALLASTARASV
jgi:hypothetical protein